MARIFISPAPAFLTSHWAWAMVRGLPSSTKPLLSAWMRLNSASSTSKVRLSSTILPSNISSWVSESIFWRSRLPVEIHGHCSWAASSWPWVLLPEPARPRKIIIANLVTLLPACLRSRQLRKSFWRIAALPAPLLLRSMLNTSQSVARWRLALHPNTSLALFLQLIFDELGYKGAICLAARTAARRADNPAHVLHGGAAGFGDFFVDDFGNLFFGHLFWQVGINNGFFGQLGVSPLVCPALFI